MSETEKVISATSKYLRISSTKVEIVIKKIRKKSYKEALEILKYLPQKAASLIWQTLYSAVSNAIHNFECEKDELVLKEVFVTKGPILKRMKPRARGREFAIQKKLSHITVKLTKKLN